MKGITMKTIRKSSIAIAIAAALTAPAVLFAAEPVSPAPMTAQMQPQMQARMQAMQARMQAMQQTTDPAARMPIMSAQMQDMQAMMKDFNTGCPMGGGAGGPGMMGGGMHGGPGMAGQMPGMHGQAVTPAK
ncbi:MAG: hypothetical protein WBV56_05160 [Azonexus sp.]